MHNSGIMVQYIRTRHCQQCILKWTVMLFLHNNIIMVEILWLYMQYHSVPGKRPWALKHNLWFLARMGAYPGYKFHMFVWKLRRWPLENQHIGAYPGVGTSPGHYDNYIQRNVWRHHLLHAHKYLSKHIICYYSHDRGFIHQWGSE